MQTFASSSPNCNARLATDIVTSSTRILRLYVNQKFWASTCARSTNVLESAMRPANVTAENHACVES